MRKTNWPPIRPRPGIHAWPAVPTPEGATILSLLSQLEESQWWPAERLRGLQLIQLEQLVRHAFKTVPWYRESLAKAGYAPDERLTWQMFRQLPVLSRMELHEQRARLETTALPPGHGSVYEITTGGSTGRPVRAKASQLHQLFWQVTTTRDHLWHGRDLSKTLGALRYLGKTDAPYPEGLKSRIWDPGTGAAFATGPALALSYLTPVREQTEWLIRKDPDYLVIHPTLLREVLNECDRQQVRPASLKGITTVAELLPPALRTRVRDAWGVEIQDIYSAMEVGYMALQCPEHEHYHAQAESVLVELLDEEDMPVREGETGRVVVTPLHNYAMPLIRYAVGDFAEQGPPCPCGRGLPVLSRIMGRTRNMLTLPNGDIIWPMTDRTMFGAGIADSKARQWQVAQLSRTALEVRLVADTPLSAAEEQAVRDSVADVFQHRFDVRFVYMDEIPRSPSGKYEDFVSELLG